MEQPWRQDFCHAWWWYRAGWWTKPWHNLQNWLFQHQRVCSHVCRLTFVLPPVSPRLFVVWYSVCSEYTLWFPVMLGRRWAHWNWDGWEGGLLLWKSILVSDLFPHIFWPTPALYRWEQGLAAVQGKCARLYFLFPIKHAGTVSVRGSGSWLLAFCRVWKSLKARSYCVPVKTGFILQHASLV